MRLLGRPRVLLPQPNTGVLEVMIKGRKEYLWLWPFQSSSGSLGLLRETKNVSPFDSLSPKIKLQVLLFISPSSNSISLIQLKLHPWVREAALGGTDSSHYGFFNDILILHHRASVLCDQRLSPFEGMLVSLIYLEWRFMNRVNLKVSMV